MAFGGGVSLLDQDSEDYRMGRVWEVLRALRALRIILLILKS